MKRKPVVPREQANRDVGEAVAYYLNEGSEAVALGFIDTLEKAYGLIARHPATGSPRYAHELNLPGLRAFAFLESPQLWSTRPSAPSTGRVPGQTFTLPRRKALATTDTELKLIATAAIMGDSSRPNAG